MEKVFTTPVLLIVFNRPSETKTVLEAIRKIKPARLFVSADGPRPGNENDLLKGNEVKEIVKEMVDWPCDLQLMFRQDNLGCSKGPRYAYDWFFSNVDEGIILEDDCVPSRSFFLYCQALLDKYRNDRRIFTINGNNFGFEYKGKESYFLGRFMNPCGWATWKRSYELVDYSLEKWDNISRRELFLHSRLNSWWDDDLGWIRYWRDIFDRTRSNFINGIPVSYWDYQWMFTQLYHKQWSIIPSRNLITNIGYNEGGTHITDFNDPLANLPAHELNFPLAECSIDTSSVNREFERDYVKRRWCYQKSRRGIFFYIKMSIAKTFEKWTKKSS